MGARIPGLLVAAALAVAPRAHAIDGVIEINDAIAQEGSLPGDSPGYPVLITESGSYVLTGDLTPGDDGGIAVRVDDATIDLNGFAIIGSAACTGAGTALACESASARPGILANSAGTGNRIRVRNGTVRNFGGLGIQLTAGTEHSLEDVTLRHNAQGGARLAGQAAVRDCLVQENGGTGVDIDGGSVADSRILGNQTSGIFSGIGDPLSVRGNVVAGSGTEGVYARGPTLVRDNVIDSNGASGVRCLDSTARCLIVENELNENFTQGLVLNVDSGYAGNSIRSHSTNPASVTVAGGVEIGTNLCDGNSTCP